MFKSQYGSIINTFKPHYASNCLIVTGAIVCCVCYLGILGSLRENHCMLISFYIVLFLLMLVELAMACIFLVVGREIDKYFEADFRHALDVYIQSTPTGNQTLKDEFHSIQARFDCCGVDGPLDWNGTLPISCCKLDPCNVFPIISWEEGCLGKLKAWFEMNFLSLGAGVVSIAILQTLCIVMSCPIMCNFRMTGRGYK
ncbi:tetraspanin-4-like isoform X2 [Engraulis encrasicolus]